MKLVNVRLRWVRKVRWEDVRRVLPLTLIHVRVVRRSFLVTIEPLHNCVLSYDVERRPPGRPSLFKEARVKERSVIVMPVGINACVQRRVAKRAHRGVDLRCDLLCTAVD